MCIAPLKVILLPTFSIFFNAQELSEFKFSTENTGNLSHIAVYITMTVSTPVCLWPCKVYSLIRMFPIVALNPLIGGSDS